MHRSVARFAVRCSLAFGALGAALPAQAQWEGGLAVGPSAFTITGSDRSDFAPRTAFGARVWVERELRPGVAIGTAAQYFSKGARGTSTLGEILPDEPGIDPSREIKLRLNYPYLEVPVYLAVSPPVRGRLRPQFYAGAHVSFAQAGYVSYAVPGGEYTAGEREGSLRERDAGITAGVLGRLDTDRFGRIVAGVHLSAGLQNLREATPALRALGGLAFIGIGF